MATYEYVSLDEAAAMIGRKVNVFAVVLQADQFRPTRGSDFICTLVLADFSSHDRSMNVSVFAGDKRQLPFVASVGDIIRIHRMEMVTFEGAAMGKVKVGPASFALFSSAALASLSAAAAPDSTPPHPYAFYGTSYTPLDNVQQQLMSLLQCWSARHLFALPGSEYMRTLADVREEEPFDICCQVWYAKLLSSSSAVLYVWDGTDLPLPPIDSPAAPIPSPSSSSQPLSSPPLMTSTNPHPTSAPAAAAAPVAPAAAPSAHHSEAGHPSLWTSDAHRPGSEPEAQAQQQPATPPPSSSPASRGEANRGPEFTIAGKPPPPMSVLERAPPFGSLLPVVCNVEEPLEVLRRVHVSCQVDEGRSSYVGSRQAVGDEGMDIDGAMDGERDGGAAGRGDVAPSADPLKDGSANPERGGDSQQDRGADDSAAFPQWVRLRNIRVALLRSKGVWIGMFNRMSRISPVPVNSDPVARIQRRQSEREAAAGWNDKWNPMLAAALQSPVAACLAPFPPISSLRQVFTHSQVPWKYHCVVRVVHVSALQPSAFCRLITPPTPPASSSSPSSTLPSASTTHPWEEGGAATGDHQQAPFGCEDVMSQEMEDSDVMAMATEEQWPGQARPQPSAAAAEAGGGTGASSRVTARDRSNTRSDNKEWVPALRLVVEDASGRLSVLLCGQHAEVFLASSASAMVGDSIASRLVMSRLARLLGYSPPTHGLTDDLGDGGNNMSRAHDARDPPALECCIFSHYMCGLKGKRVGFQLFATKLM